MRVKKLKSTLRILLAILFISGLSYAKPVVTNISVQDSVNIMVEASLFFESYKNKEYNTWTLEHGWKLLKTKPDAFEKYHPYLKMEKIMWTMHADTTGKVSPATKKMLNDSILVLYNMAVKYDTANTGNFLVRKAYVMEFWKKDSVKKVIAAYKKAFSSRKEIDDEAYYKDLLGRLYIENANDSNDYKIKALELYSKLSQEDPHNAMWVARIESLAENENQLVDITGKAWDLDKSNTEKAWKYASLCIGTQQWKRALVPLKFLISKAPDVINYWREIARVYDKLGRTNEAIQSYKKLISLQPNNKDSYVNIAIIYKNLEQYSVARSYLMKAEKVNPKWDYPYYILGTIYEQAARNCGFEFMDRVVYQLAVNTYKIAYHLGGSYSSSAAGRIDALASSVPQKEDYFFRQLKPGTTIKIEGKCYGWINRTITVPNY